MSWETIPDSLLLVFLYGPFYFQRVMTSYSCLKKELSSVNLKNKSGKKNQLIRMCPWIIGFNKARHQQQQQKSILVVKKVRKFITSWSYEVIWWKLKCKRAKLAWFLALYFLLQDNLIKGRRAWKYCYHIWATLPHKNIKLPYSIRMSDFKLSEEFEIDVIFLRKQRFYRFHTIFKDSLCLE